MRSVPDGNVPSAGIRLTGISSPSPTSILAVTRRTNSGASSGTIFARSRVLVAIAGTGTSYNRASVPSTAAKFLPMTVSPLLRIGLADRLLDVPDRCLLRQHAGDGEEAGLQHGIDACTETHLARNLRGIDDEEAQPLVDDLLLHRPRKFVPNSIGAERAVQEETAPGAASRRTSWRAKKPNWWQATNPAEAIR